ncbi:MAG: type IV pilus assembly protein PilM [Verrucomicrobia bacterium]|nr:type IV pilus assembly protein PilM [Verrucomicrobiota bacterium]
MAKPKRILAVDVGASKVVVAEFVIDKNAPPMMLTYGIGHLEIDPQKDQHSPAIIAATLKDVMRETGIRPAPLLMTVSGQTVFPRFVKLPPVSKDKLRQIVQYEAEQNVPFPINEVVWDYQLLSGEDAVDTNVMLVAAKIENIATLTHSVGAARLEPEVVDAAPLALYNAVCYNYGIADGCTMILDFGARSSNLVFVEENRVFSRSVPVSGNTITSEIAKQFDISFADAEALKKEHAEVGLGGVFEGPDNEDAARISKIVRNVVTRLHAEVNRSINFYRSQQGGNPPERVLLSGGSSIMPNTDTFFEEKLNVPVEYLNPFISVTVGSNVDQARVEEDIHLLGEVVGLALRCTPYCRIEINLMPPDLIALKTFRRRLPYFAGSVVVLIVALLALWGLNFKTMDLRNQQLAESTKRVQDTQTMTDKLKGIREGNGQVQARVDDLTQLIEQKTMWLEMIKSLNDCLLEGMWISRVSPIIVNSIPFQSFEITATGFKDLLGAYDSTDKTTAEVFRDRLRASPYFSDDTEIQKQRFPNDYTREYTLEVHLERPMTAR